MRIDSTKCVKMRLRTPLRELQRSPSPLTGFFEGGVRRTEKEKGGKGREGEKGGENKKRGLRGSPKQIPGYAHACM